MAIRQAMRRLMPAVWARSSAPARTLEQKALLSDYYSGLASIGPHSTYRTRPWPVERAVAEAYERIIWIFKAVEVISSSAAQLTFELRQDNEVVEDHPLYRILNKRANPLETGRQFRKRLSAQILLSKRGAFVEVTKSRSGEPVRMDLLPPGRTMPIPGSGQDPISHFEVMRVDGSRYQIEPERVRWFREPHPLDPYCGVTPLEAAGMSIELDFFSRLTNVAFLRNDARPGGIVAINGEMGDEEMDRIESRFAKGAPNAGSLTVVNGEVSYIDLAAQPRDMQYETTTTIAKREILTAFGVPESVIGDASGRTWDNASQELFNFWTQTMPPHLDMLITGLDEDSEDNLKGSFDTSEISVLQRTAIERRAEAREEWDKGLIRIDEYRKLAGYEEIDNEHTRSLFLTAGKTEVATTDEDAKALEEEKQKAFERQQALKQPAPDANQKQNGQESSQGDQEPPQGGQPGTSRTKPSGSAGKPTQERSEARTTKSVLITLPGQGQPVANRARPTIRLVRSRESKADSSDRESVPEPTAQERLEAALEAALAALMVRLTARAASRLSSPKTRKHTRHWMAESKHDTRIGTKVIDAEQAVDPVRWESETRETAQPLVEAAAMTAAAHLMADLGGEENEASLLALVASTVAGVVSALGASAARQAAKLVGLLRKGDEDGRDMATLAAMARGFAQPMAGWASAVAIQGATATINGARDAAARRLADDDPSRDIQRSWLSRRDGIVRASHRAADGQKRALEQPFNVGDARLRYPGDELGPLHEVANCRCRLLYRSRSSGRFVAAPEETTKNPYLLGLAATGTDGKHLPGRHDQSTHGRGGTGRQHGGRRDLPGGTTGAYRAAPRTSAKDWTEEDLAPVIAAATNPDAAKDRDDALGEIFRKQGFDALPELGDVDEAIKNGGAEIFRGIHGANAQQYADEFKTGEHFPGLGVFGNGTYSSTNRAEAKTYGDAIVRMALRPDAKVLDFEDAKTAAIDNLNQALVTVASLPPDQQGSGRQLAIVAYDFGRFAAMNGFDAIHVKGGGRNDFFIVLNRTAVVVEP